MPGWYHPPGECDRGRTANIRLSHIVHCTVGGLPSGLIAVALTAMIRNVRVSAILGAASFLVIAACDLVQGGGAAAEPTAKSDGDTKKSSANEGAGERAGDDGGAGEAEGGDEEVAEAAAQSAVAWNVQLESVPRSVSVTEGGTVFAVAEAGIQGFADGKPTWKKDGAFGTVARLLDGGVVATTGATIVAFDPASGDERFRVDVPAPPGWPTKTRKGDPIPPPAIIASATFGSQLLVADQEARFFEVDPPTCAKGDPACLRPAGLLDGEVLEVGTRLIVADDGTRYLVEEDTMRVFDQALATVFELESPGRIVSIIPFGQGNLALAANGQVALLQMPRCAGSSLRIPAVPTGSKHCFRWRYGIDLDDAAPAIIDENTLGVNGARRMQAASEGTDSWKSPIGSVGPVLSGTNGLLYTIAVDGEGEAKLAVKAVHPQKGTVEWTVALPFAPAEAPAPAEGEVAADVVIPETMSLDAQGGYIVAALDQNVALLTVPAS